MDYTKCPCVAYEPDEDPDVDTGETPPEGTCTCGHAQDQHTPSLRYLADWSCKAATIATQ